MATSNAMGRNRYILIKASLRHAWLIKVEGKYNDLHKLGLRKMAFTGSQTIKEDKIA